MSKSAIVIIAVVAAYIVCLFFRVPAAVNIDNTVMYLFGFGK